MLCYLDCVTGFVTSPCARLPRFSRAFPNVSQTIVFVTGRQPPGEFRSNKERHVIPSTPHPGRVQHLDPAGLPWNPAFTNVISGTGPVRTLWAPLVQSLGGEISVRKPSRSFETYGRHWPLPGPAWSTRSSGTSTLCMGSQPSRPLRSSSMSGAIAGTRPRLRVTDPGHQTACAVVATP